MQGDDLEAENVGPEPGLETKAHTASPGQGMMVLRCN